MLNKVTSIILAGISSLAEYKTKLPELDICRTCMNCGRAAALHRHGRYDRKSDRQSEPDISLNQVEILRFICKFCRKTCSPLPECIPPRRWHLWEVQQAVIQGHLAGKSRHAISCKFKVARSTCRRWIEWLQDKFLMHADVLRNVPGKLSEHLVHCFEVKSFWQRCFTQVDLSRAMLLCHNAGIDVP